MSLLLAAALLVLAVIAIPIGRRLTGDFFHPAAIVAAAWCLSFGLFQLGLMPFDPPTPGTTALVLATVGLLVAGAIVGQSVGQRWPGRRSPMPLPGARAWVWLFSALGLAGVALYAHESIAAFGWGGFRDASAIRWAIATHSISTTFLVLEFFCIVAPLLAVAVSLTGNRQLRSVDWIGPLACVLATCTTTDRTQFFLVILSCLFMFVLRRGPDLSSGRLFAVLSAAATLLVVNFLLVDVWTRKSERIPVPVSLAVHASPPIVGDADRRPAVEATSNGSVAPTPVAPQAVGRPLQFVATLYVYATASYAALGQLMDRPLESTHGLHVVYPVARFAQRMGVVHGPLPSAIPPFVNVLREPGPTFQFNAYTFLYYPLMDFGPRGALAYASLIGVLSGFVYARLVRRRESMVYLLLCGQIGTALTLSIFVNKFNNTASWYVLVGTIAPFVITRTLGWGAARS